MLLASQSDDRSSEQHVNSAAGRSGQEMLWEGERCSNLIMNLREANNDPLQSAVLDARVPRGCGPGLSGVLKREGRATVNILLGGASPPRRNVNFRDLDPKSGQPPRSLVSVNLEGHSSLCASGVLPCPGVPQTAPLHTHFPVPLLRTPRFVSPKCPDLYNCT